MFYNFQFISRILIDLWRELPFPRIIPIANVDSIIAESQRAAGQFIYETEYMTFDENNLFQLLMYRVPRIITISDVDSIFAESQRAAEQFIGRSIVSYFKENGIHPTPALWPKTIHHGVSSCYVGNSCYGVCHVMVSLHVITLWC